MHNPIVGNTGMEQENHMAAPDANYGASDHWVHDNYHYQPSTMAAEYGSFYAPNIAPMPSSHPSMPDGLMSSEPVRMPPIPAPAHSSAMHPQLPMLITPGHPGHHGHPGHPGHPAMRWPSQITNPVSGGPYSAPAMALPPVLHAPPPPPAPIKPARLPGRSGSQPRRTLTDEERRNMCRYHEENPHVKQSEIGAKFNVERSTVSKVLRWKDKYLCTAEDRSTSPIKRTKGKFPDIERALSNWARNQKKSGKDLTDEQIREKAQYFAASVGNDNPMRTASANWLEKFKQKNNIGRGRLTRRASEANIPDSTQLASASVSTSSPTMAAQSSGSVTSPTAGDTGTRASPTSAGPTEEDKDSAMNDMFDFGVSSGEAGHDGSGGQQHADGMNAGGTQSAMDTSGGGPGGGGGFKQMNMSTTSLQTSFSDPAASGPASSTYSTLSPSTPFTFSPDPNSVAAFPDPSFQRPRSQTFPTLDLQFEQPPGSTGTDPAAPKYGTPSTAPPSALEASMDGTQSFANIDSALGVQPTSAPPHVLHRTSSSGSLRGRATTPASMAGGSSPGSPTQEDARKAAETLLNFIQTLGPASGSPVDDVDIQNLLRLTEKLRFPAAVHHQPQQIAPSLLSRSSTGLGGLSRIPETEAEMGGMKSEVLMG